MFKGLGVRVLFRGFKMWNSFVLAKIFSQLKSQRYKKEVALTLASTVRGEAYFLREIRFELNEIEFVCRELVVASGTLFFHLSPPRLRLYLVFTFLYF